MSNDRRASLNTKQQNLVEKRSKNSKNCPPVFVNPTASEKQLMNLYESQIT